MTDEKRVQNGHHRGFHRRGVAGIDGAENDEGRHEREEAFAAAAHESAQFEFFGFVPAEIVFAGQQPGCGDHGEGHQKAGQKTGREHGGHRQIAQNGVNDHGVAGGDENADGAARGGRRAGVLARITVADHGGNEDGAHGRHRARTGAGDGREEGAGQNGGDAQAAVHAPHHLLDHIHNLLGDVAVFHQRPGHHKTGDGQQRKEVEPVEQGIVDDGHGQDVAAEQGDRRRDGQRHENGDAQQKKDGHRDQGKFKRTHWGFSS